MERLEDGVHQEPQAPVGGPWLAVHQGPRGLQERPEGEEEPQAQWLQAADPKDEEQEGPAAVR